MIRPAEGDMPVAHSEHPVVPEDHSAEGFDLPGLSLGRRVEFITILKDVDEARACKLGRPQDFTGLLIEGEDPVFHADEQMLGQAY